MPLQRSVIADAIERCRGCNAGGIAVTRHGRRSSIRSRHVGVARAIRRRRTGRTAPVLRKPDWIRVKAPGSPVYRETTAIVREHGLVTVCEEAGCPNIGECWSKKHATFMIMGDTCTRACAFCNVRTGMPGAARPGRAGAGRRRHRQARPRPRRRHLGRPRRPRRRRRGAFRRAPSPRSAGKSTRDHRGPDAGFPAQGRRDRDGRRGEARRLQPQPRDRAVEVPDGPAGRALLRLAPPAAAGQGARPGDVHQVRHHGRPRRGAERGPPADGRPPRGQRRFPHHRPVPAADAASTTRSSASSRRRSSRPTRPSPTPRAS